MARQRYFEEGILPTGVVSEAVFQSWMRCYRSNRQPRDPVEFQPVSVSRSHLAVQKNRELLDAWLSELPEIGNALGSAHCSAVLTDASGVLIGVTPSHPTEQRIIQGLLTVVFTEYSKSWKPVYDINFEYIRSEMNSQFANIATPSEIVVSTTFTLEFGGATADMHICFPYSMLEPIRDLLYSTMQSDQLSSDKRWIGTLRKQLQGAEVEIVAQLGSGKITLGQILKLKVGDVIPLNIPEKIEAMVDSVPLMECTYGQQSGQYALKVDRFIAATSSETPHADPASGEKNG